MKDESVVLNTRSFLSSFILPPSSLLFKYDGLKSVIACVAMHVTGSVCFLTGMVENR
jgi:hypothetical protein